MDRDTCCRCKKKVEKMIEMLFKLCDRCSAIENREKQ